MAKATTLKGKCHIVKRKYKVNGFMKTINHTLQIEVGAGNNQYEPNIYDETNYIKISNRGDLDIKVRLSKDGKEAGFPRYLLQTNIMVLLYSLPEKMLQLI